MVVFTKKYKPLTAKLMFKLIFLSVIMITIIPQIFEIVSFRMGMIDPIIMKYTSAIIIGLGTLSFIVGLVCLICTLLEKRQ